MLCDIAMPDGTPFEGDPRSTLKRVLDDADDVLRDVKTALEVEFYLFARDADGAPTTRTVDAGSYFDFSPADRGDEARTAMAAALEAMGIGVSSAHHEHGAGQHELDLAAGSVLGTADRLITVRGVVKQIAGPAPHPRDVHAQADRSRRPAAGCTSTSRSARSTKSCACTRSPACSITRRASPPSAIRR